MSQFTGPDGKVIDIDAKKMQKRAFTLIPLFVLLLLIIVSALNSVYILENKENGVILRFGREHELVTTPGVHFKIPLIDAVRKVDVRTIYNMEYGFRTTTASQSSEAAIYTDHEDEATVIVDGANNNASIALIELIIQYKVANPVDYLFKVQNVEGTLRLALEDVVRASVQSLTLDEAKTEKERIDEIVLPALQNKINEYEAGLEIVIVATQNVQFLPNVEAAYQQKENANQYKNGKKEDAEKYYNTIIPQAEAEAIKLVEEANAYKAETVANANAAVASFNALYTEYLNNPEILKERYYIDAMTEFLTNNKVIIDTTTEGSIYKFYNMDDNSIKETIIN